MHIEWTLRNEGIHSCNGCCNKFVLFFRAMRNRGLEVSLQPVDEDVDKNVLDLMAILRHYGLTTHTSINKLLRVHYAIRDLNIGNWIHIVRIFLGQVFN